jgi:acetoacetyl-CoA synthetase
VSDDADFFDSGGTSRQSMTLLRRLRLELGHPIDMQDFLLDPTVRGVAAASTVAFTEGIHVLQEGDPALAPLYLVHGAYGDVDSYHFVVQHLDTPRPVHGLSSATGETAAASIRDLAAEHVDRVTAAQPTGPVLLAGFSFGGLVAFEMARQLTAAGREVAFLGLIDVRPPYGSLTPVQRLLRKTAGALAMVVPGISDTPLRTALADARRVVAMPAEEVALADATATYDAYRWAPYAGEVTFFQAARRIPVLSTLLYAWRRVVPRLTVVDVPGAHYDMLGEEHSPALGAAMSAHL